jgi:cardiolipin synthase (CMP-forming)
MTAMAEPQLEASERRVLTIPNVMSLLRLASVPVFVALFVTEREESGVVILAIGSFSDFFDGYIARRTNSVTELGRLLDPLADRVLIVALAVALVATDLLPLWLAGAVIVRDVLVLALWPVVDRRSIQRIRVNFVGKAATAALLVGLGLLAWSATTWPVAELFGDAGPLFVGIGALLYWIAGVIYAREALRNVSAPGGSGAVE